MTETARITKIEGDAVTVEVAFETCEACRSSFCAVKAHAFAVRNSDHLELSVGDTVEICTPPGRAITAAIIVFVIPLIGFVAAYLLGRALGFAAESGSTLLGIAGLLVGLGSSFLVSRKRRELDVPAVSAVTAHSPEAHTETPRRSD